MDKTLQFFLNENINLPTKNTILSPHKKYEIHTFSYKNNTASQKLKIKSKD